MIVNLRGNYGLVIFGFLILGPVILGFIIRGFEKLGPATRKKALGILKYVAPPVIALLLALEYYLFAGVIIAVFEGGGPGRALQIFLALYMLIISGFLPLRAGWPSKA